VGLVQRALEEAGLATVALSVIPELTAATGAPRVAGIEYPMGRPLGRPGDAAGQRAVLEAALRVLVDAHGPGTVVQLPFEWPGDARQTRTHPPEPPPIARLLKRKPWLLPRLVRREPPAR
jgi:hypothetical protein